MAGGRPTKYKTEYAQQASKLCALGATDAQLADFFGVAIEEIAIWGYSVPEFAKAITPTPADIRIYAEKFESQRSCRNAKRRESTSIGARLNNSMRARMYAAVKGRSSLAKEMPYTCAELMSHLQSKFVVGMSWENYGDWEIDHIRPCASFDMEDPAQFAQCWSLENLQPLWGDENRKKGAKYGS
jgi:hypothetical protein